MISFGLGVFPKIILSENIFKNKLPVSYAKSILDSYYDPFHRRYRSFGTGWMDLEKIMQWIEVARET